MARPIPKSFNYIPQYNGDEGLVLSYLEANSQTFKKGDLVRLAGASDLTLNDGGSGTVSLGIALKDATNVTSGNAVIPVQVIRGPNDVFSVYGVSGLTFAASMIGENHIITRTAAGNWEVGVATTANDVRVKILGSLEGGDGQGPYTAGGPLLVRFLQADGDTTGLLQYFADASF